MVHYNSWPLGALPVEWQRPEPNQIKAMGYDWDDPRDIVGMFERKLAEYSGAKYAVTTDCCTNAIFLALKYLDLTPRDISVPRHTYASVPMQVHHAGHTPVFLDFEWSGIYQLGDTGVYDGAARFTENMYLGQGALQTLSFQIKKRLPIGRGGAILTDSFEAYKWLKLATYDGRNLDTPYDSPGHISMLGWHYYMTPEDAARGILLMDQLPKVNDDTMSWKNYPDLSSVPALSQLWGKARIKNES